jgi:DNA-binding XRE family transcriptional regulator
MFFFFDTPRSKAYEIAKEISKFEKKEQEEMLQIIRESIEKIEKEKIVSEIDICNKRISELLNLLN